MWLGITFSPEMTQDLGPKKFYRNPSLISNEIIGPSAIGYELRGILDIAGSAIIRSVRFFGAVLPRTRATHTRRGGTPALVCRMSFDIGEAAYHLGTCAVFGTLLWC